MSNISFNANTNKTFQPFVSTDNKGHSSYEKREDKATLQQDIYDNLKNKKRKVNALIALGSTASLAAIVFIAVVTGKSQKISKKLQSIFGGVESKFANVKDKHLHKILITTFGVFDRLGKVFTNTSPIKDWALYQALGQTKITRNVRGVISKFFTNENRSSVSKSLKKSRESYNEFITSVETAIRQSESNRGLIKNEKKFEEMKKIMAAARNTPDFLLPHSFEEHYSIMQKDMDFLSQEISFKKLFSKESLKGFVPESILTERRSTYTKRLFNAKNNVSCSFTDMSEYSRNRLDDTNMLVYSIKEPHLQKNLRDCSVQLDNRLKKYVQEAGNKESRATNLKLIQTSIGNFKKEVELLTPTETQKKLLVHIDEYENLFKEQKIGVVQDIRMLAGEAWGNKSEFDLNIKKNANVHTKDLNLSLTRMINMFDKQRDITLGSGPADVLGLLSPVALFGWALYNDDSKDKKVGTSLELGIPIVGGMLVYLRTLALQYNGVRALATSLGTGVLLNLAGSLVYKKYMAVKELERKKNHEAIPQQL